MAQLSEAAAEQIAIEANLTQSTHYQAIESKLEIYWAIEAEHYVTLLFELTDNDRNLAKRQLDTQLIKSDESIEAGLAVALEPEYTQLATSGSIQAVAVLGEGAILPASTLQTISQREAKVVAKQTSKTTLEIIRKLISDSVNERKQSPQATAKQIREKFSGFSKSRALMISRTESAKVYTTGSLETYKDNGVEYKEWYTNLDGRTCDVCGPLHGAQAKINADYPDDGRYFGSQPGPPMHPNCRCVILPVIDD